MIDPKEARWEDSQHKCHCGKLALYGLQSIDRLEWEEDGYIHRKAYLGVHYFCSDECVRPGDVYKVDHPPILVPEDWAVPV